MKQRHFFTSAMAILSLVVLSLAMAPATVADTNAIPQRSDIDDKYKWNVEHIYPDLETWESDYNVVKENLARFDQYRGHLGDSPAKLLECLKLSDSLGLIVDNLYVYANLKLDEDNREGKYQELAGRISALAAEVREAKAFIQPEILTLGKDRILSMLNSAPELDTYRFYIEDMVRQNEHVLSAEQEALLAMVGPVAAAPGKIFSRLEDADMTFGQMYDEDSNLVELTRGRIYRFLESDNRRVRKDARIEQNKAYVKVQNTLAATLESSVRKDYFYTKARNYNTCLESSLDANNIPTSVFHALIDAVNANLAPLHKWTEIRKRVLGIDTLYSWDQYVPLVTGFDKEYSYEEAQKMVVEALEPMGEKYLADFTKGFEPGSGWIDVYETQGKGSGAYSWGTYSSHPYVLLNHSGSLEDVFTLAHEMGHAMQTYYVNRNEPYIYEGYSLFVAEVASTCNEALMMKYMLEHAADKKEKMYLLNHYIQQIIGTFFTQTMFSEFELAIHERIESGEAVSAEWFRQTYRDIYQKYYGPALVIDEYNDIGGMRISHFYRQYYVYQYATSYAAAQMISQKILEGDKAAIDKYMTFLATGASNYPVEILRAAGVDMTTPEPVNATIKLFSELVDEFERLLNEG
ncbi:MAG: oligoendopeptidase F [Candidatus Zixiibacteriota bacterium]